MGLTKHKKSGPKKTPIILQLEKMEGGAACLAMILAYYKKWVPLEQLRSECGVSRDGINMESIVEAAQTNGLRASVRHIGPDIFLEEAQFPCIILWNHDFFIVCNGVAGSKVIMTDPDNGRIVVNMDTFRQLYSGVSLYFEPGPDFVTGGKPPRPWKFFHKRIRGNHSAFFMVMFSALLTTSVGIVIPQFSRMFSDRILPGTMHRTIIQGFLILFGVMVALQLCSQIFHVLMISRVNGKLASTSNLKFLWHVLRMPMKFFAQRFSGDLTARQMENDIVSQTLVRVLAPTVIQLLFLVLYLVVMMRYSLLLTAVGLSVMLINLLISKRIIQKSRDLIRVQMRDESRMSSTTMSGVDMIDTIKSSGAEIGFFEQWSGLYASARKNKSKVNKLNRYISPLPVLLQQISSVIILTLGTWLIIDRQISSGIFLSFQAMMTYLNEPVNRFLSAGRSIEEMHSYMERIEDVMNYPAEITDEQEDIAEEILAESRKLSGNIELSHVTFGYSRQSPPLIRDFSLVISPGSRIALVGESGSGKSTIARLIAGLYDPWEGTITFDGKSRNEIPRPVFTGSVAIVDQDVTMFEDSIENNIKMFDTSIQDFEMILAARDAGIHEDIMRRKGGYHAMLEEGGSDISGGQRQRLEIARVLAQDPSILIMDEATSALDANTEYEVSEAIRRRHITCLIMAHRLSAIRDCDEILVLDKGKVAERGTHEELIRKNGLYNRLVTTV